MEHTAPYTGLRSSFLLQAFNHCCLDSLPLGKWKYQMFDHAAILSGIPAPTNCTVARHIWKLGNRSLIIRGNTHGRCVMPMNAYSTHSFQQFSCFSSCSKNTIHSLQNKTASIKRVWHSPSV